MKQTLILAIFLLLSVSTSSAVSFWKRPDSDITISRYYVKSFEDFDLLEAATKAGNGQRMIDYLVKNKKCWLVNAPRKCRVVQFIERKKDSPIVVFSFVGGNPEETYVADFRWFEEGLDQMDGGLPNRQAPGCARVM